MERKTDLRVERTYMFLHNAFTSLMEEKRFDEFTVNELCERAMIRRTTFYKHFADKYEYFTFYAKEISAGFRDQLPPDVPADDPDAYLLYMSRELLRFVDRHNKLVMNIADSTMFPVLLDILSVQIAEEVLQAFRQMGGAEKISIAQMEGTASFYAGGILNILRRWMLAGTPLDEEKFMQVVSCFSLSRPGGAF